MLSLVRGGPKILIIESSFVEILDEYLIKDLGAVECPVNTAFKRSDENFTIILLTDKIKEVVKLSDVIHVLMIKKEADVIFSNIIRDKKHLLISNARIAPRIIIMRTFEDTDRVIDEIRKDYGGTIGSFSDILEENNHGTVIAFTKNNLNKPVSLENIYEKSLYIEDNYSRLIKELKIHDLKYLNASLKNKEWYELKIKIYDVYGEYSLHYERLRKIIEHLDLGLILGERWGTDAATVFLAVGVYRIRLFTFHEPEYIKRILVGLEHLDDGTRIVDLDLYSKRRKIHWSDLKNRESKNREELGKELRKEIITKLENDVIQEIIELEKKILMTRK